MEALYKKMLHDIEQHMTVMTNANLVMAHLHPLIMACKAAHNMMDKPSATALVQKVRFKIFFH